MASGRKVQREEAAELLQLWQQSGEPMSKWCAARGLNWYSLSAYKGWLDTRWNEPPVPAFAEVVMAETEPCTPPGGRYRIEIDDVVIVVDDTFRGDTLRRLLQVVAGC